jgi:hypothetical protein
LGIYGKEKVLKKLKETSKIKALALNMVWKAWLARNQNLFENKETLPLKCVV